MSKFTATVTVNDFAVTATIEDDWSVSISDAESHELGTGWWDGCIQDCPADLGDEVYEALDYALINKGATDHVDRGVHFIDVEYPPKWIAVQTSHGSLTELAGGNMTYGEGSSRREALASLATEPKQSPVPAGLDIWEFERWYVDFMGY